MSTYRTGQGRDSDISAMDTFADVDDEIERIRTAGRDYSISGIDRLCDFAKAAWGRRELSSSQEERIKSQLLRVIGHHTRKADPPSWQMRCLLDDLKAIINE